ncbi:hypothetical protein BY996DRAFT_6959822 [Phakopsora pachyrhizi]|nr:hypothetical protein BY996DRAFT_6959822 [Phakopsora pachyrhizi]
MVKYSISTVLSMVCYKTLIKSSSGGEDYQSIDDLTTGAYQYLFDFCYLSCLVWVGCLLFESSWKIYLLVIVLLSLSLIIIIIKSKRVLWY